MGNAAHDRVVPLDCIDDQSALAAAELLVDGHDVEVWRGYRKLGTLHHYMRAKPKRRAPHLSIVANASKDKKARNPRS
jgi:hypothetical protein